MVNKPKDQKRTDTDFQAANEIYKLAKREYDEQLGKIKQELVTKIGQHEAIGALKRAKLDREFSKFVDAVVLYRMKESRAYKTLGYNWEEFCNLAGYDVRDADRIVNDIRPIVEAFSAVLSDFLGLKFNEIRMLGKAKSDNLVSFKDNKVTYKDIEIPITAEDFNIVLKSIQEDLANQKKEYEADKKAMERVQQDINEKLQQAHREFDQFKSKVSKLAEEKGLSPEQDAFLTKMESMRVQFDHFYMVHVEPETIMELIPNDDKPVTVRMRVAYLKTLEYMASQLNVALGVATDLFGEPRMQDPHYDTLTALKIEKIGA